MVKVSKLISNDHGLIQSAASPTSKGTASRNQVLDGINAVLLNASKTQSNKFGRAAVVRSRILSLKSKLETNIDGAVIHGRTLPSPPALRQSKERNV